MKKEDILAFNCETEEELWDFLIDCVSMKFTNGKETVKTIIKELTPKQKKDFACYCNDVFGMDTEWYIKWCHDTVVEAI